MSVVQKLPVFYSGFSPTSIPGCALWLDAADSNAFTLSGSNVTVWKDKSGNNRNTSGGVAPTYSQNGVVFTGSQYLPVTNASGLFVNTAFSIFVVETLGGSTPSRLFIGDDSINSGGASNSSLHIGYRNNSNLTFAFYFNDLEITGLSGTGTSRIWSFNMPASANRNARLNGSLVGTLGNTTKLTALTSLTIGRCFGGSYYTGTISEIVAFTRDMTSSEIQQVEGYLAYKWGLRANLPSDHSFKTRLPAVRPLLPTDISGCALWLDVADKTTLTLAGTDITGIRDKSSNMITVAISTPAPSYTSNIVNNIPGASFISNSWFRGTFPSTYTGTTLTAFFIGSMNSTTPQNGRIVSLSEVGTLDTTATHCIPFLRYLTGQQISSYRNGFLSVANITYNTVALYEAEFTGSSNILYINGVAQTPTTASSGAFSINNFGIGYLADYGSFGDNAYLRGTCGEVIVYLGTITTAQRQQIEGYLARKWGLLSSLPSGHPYVSRVSDFPLLVGVPPVVVAPVFNDPLDVSGCRLWLNAANNSSLTLSGSNVTQWADRSGNGFVASNAGTVTTTTLNQNTVVSMASTAMTIPSYSQRVFSTTFIVARALNANFILTVDQYYTYIYVANYALYYFNSTSGVVQLKDTINAYGTPIVTPNSYFILSVGYNGETTSSIYNVNGTARTMSLTGGGASADATITGTMNINQNPSGSIRDTTQVADIIVYNRSLSLSQAQQVEGYLAWKWGLQSLLPADHPYKSVSPSATGIYANGFTYFLFRTSGTFTLTTARTVNYLLVGGGGGGGDRHGGGGGAGGVLAGSFSASATTYTITVGSGGTGGNYEAGSATGGRGGDSLIVGIATAYGGGGGGTYDGNPSGTFGSGGGGGGQNRPGVAGTAGQGNTGGSGLNPGGGGGGGAGGVGTNANTSTGGIGTSLYSTHLLAVGYGTTFATTPNNPISGGVAYIGGGGGGAANSGTAPTGRTGGLGGGGTGDWNVDVITTGTPNTGGGGGGCRSNNEPSSGRAGGSGLVLLWF